MKYPNVHFPFVIDGGLSNVLENAGYDLNHELWSARLINEEPQALIDAHLKYLQSGAQCIATGSYQATTEGFEKQGFSTARSIELIRKSVDLTREAIKLYLAKNPGAATPIIAASIGPYGAFLADGSEYRGDYTLSKQALKNFHRERIRILDSCEPDLLAFETIPSFTEAVAISELLTEFDRPAWISFSCKSPKHISDGTLIRDAVKAIHGNPAIWALGVNCTDPKYISGLIDNIKAITDKHIIVYPNSGEQYDPENKKWHGKSNAETFSKLTKEWLQHGADIVGGCCRVGPAHIAQIRRDLTE